MACLSACKLFIEQLFASLGGTWPTDQKRLGNSEFKLKAVFAVDGLAVVNKITVLSSLSLYFSGRELGHVPKPGTVDFNERQSVLLQFACTASCQRSYTDSPFKTSI
jgi:hypothetical protein